MAKLRYIISSFSTVDLFLLICVGLQLIRYLCAWIDAHLCILNVHGGTAESDVVEIFEEARSLLEQPGQSKRAVYVFLDEINSCSHMGLMVEAIVHRSCQGKPLHEGIKVLAACNPYRKWPPGHNQATPGLVYQLAEQTTPDAMSSLVYRVVPLADTLADFIFDFGALNEDKERLYIHAMASGWPSLSGASQLARNIVAELILASQVYVRLVEKDPSMVSLRDVKRCLDLVNFFAPIANSTGRLLDRNASKEPEETKLASAVVLGLAHVYYYRLGDAKTRAGYWDMLRLKLGASLIFS